MWNIEDLKQHLKECIVTVKFTKADGSEREMRCTQNMNEIPVEHHPESHEQVVYDDLVKVFDLDIQEWRSFKPSRVISWVL